MTEEDVRTAQGNLLREHADAEKSLALRRAEATRLSGIVRAAADLLSDRPGELLFTGESSKDPHALRIDPATLDTTKLKQLAQEIRELEKKVGLLADQKKRAGY